MVRAKPMQPQAAGSRGETKATRTCHRFFESSGIKSVIGIKYPKMKFFLEVGSREGNPASHTPKAAVGSGWSMRSRRWKNGFLVMPPEVEVLYFMKLKGAGVPIKQS